MLSQLITDGWSRQVIIHIHSWALWYNFSCVTTKFVTVRTFLILPTQYNTMYNASNGYMYMVIPCTVDTCTLCILVQCMCNNSALLHVCSRCDGTCIQYCRVLCCVVSQLHVIIGLICNVMLAPTPWVSRWCWNRSDLYSNVYSANVAFLTSNQSGCQIE